MTRSAMVEWSTLSGVRAGAGQVEVFPVSNEEELLTLISEIRRDGRRLFPLGAGTNLIGSDETDDGVALVDGRKGLRHLRQEGESLIAGTGLPLALLASEAASAGLAGLCELSGIPGTLGGAIAMNAGALGHSLAEVLKSLVVVELDTGVRKILSGDALQGWGYRQSPLTNRQYVVEAVLRLEASEKQVEIGLLEEERIRRAQVTPKGFSCGSVFRNPPGLVAGKLLEEVGCKGMTIGPFSVSQRHANWIVNLSGMPGRATDCRWLVAEMRDLVAKKFGVELQPEWRFFEDMVKKAKY